MEKDNKKRAREGEDNNDPSERKAKKQLDVSHHHDDHHSDIVKFESKNYDYHDHENNNDDDSYVSFNNVFDFPWLHEGMISKSEEWDFEDSFTFSSSLEESCTTGGGFEFSGEGVCTTVSIETVDFPGEMFEGKNLGTLEVDDCVWSSLLNQPLHQEQQQLSDE